MIRLLDRVGRVARWGAWALVAAAALNLAAMMIQVTVDVATKYLFNAPIPGTAEIVAYYYMVAAVFLPLPLVELRNKAISVDLFWNLFPGALQRVTLALAYALQVAFFTILAIQTGADAMDAWASGALVEGIIPVLTWPGRFFLPVSFWLGVVVSSLRLIEILLAPDWRARVAHDDGGEVA